MATKYILDPSGNIKKVDSVEATIAGRGTTTIDNLSNVNVIADNSYLKEVNQNTSNKEDDNVGETFNNFLTNVQLGLLEGENDSETFKNFITTKIDHDPSFGFINPNPEKALEANFKQKDLDRTFKPFNSFTDTDRVFADEFEILTGFRLREDELVESASTALLMFTYLAEVIAKIGAIEAFVAINQLIDPSSRASEFRSVNTKLRLGKYDFTEFDIFTKYIFNVLNYPHESSNTFERIMAYFIGFTEWLSADASIDINEIVKNSSGKENFLQDMSSRLITKTKRYTLKQLFDFGNLADVALDNIIISFISTLQNTAVTALNHTSLNRVRLLLRKFYQERLFKDEVLYSAKQKENYVFGFFDDLNYYYFKFIIERIQVGLPYLKKYFYGEDEYYFANEESPENRVSAQKYSAGYSVALKKSSYAWNSSPQGKTSTRVLGIPQLLHVHSDFIKTLTLSGNPTSIEFKKTDLLGQNFYTENDLTTSNRKIPIETVNSLEEELESEYMPFYFHDLRTNEVLSFHAFIESISDSFSPDYNPTSGFGRVDDVRTYTKTVRSINLTFIIAATSEKDHDMMWYQVNKIVSMCYPQWSNGYMANTSEKRSFNDSSEDTFDLKFPFRYPFTQVPTASPLIRLRVGDVIKSNYSRTSLARLHGIGEEIKPQLNLTEAEKNKFPSVIEAKKELKRRNEANIRLRDALMKLQNQLKNGILLDENTKTMLNTTTNERVNDLELDAAEVLSERRVREKERYRAVKRKIAESINIEVLKHELGRLLGIKDGSYFYGGQNSPYEKNKREMSRLARITGDTSYYFQGERERTNYTSNPSSLDRDIKASRDKISKYNKQILDNEDLHKKNMRKLKEDINTYVFKEKSKILDSQRLYERDVLIDKTKEVERQIRNQTEIVALNTENLNEYKEKIGNEFKKIKDSEIANLEKEIKSSLYDKVISPTAGEEGNKKVNNPITISYESGMSRGLAGFITNLDISYNDSTWDTGRIGSKAPMLVKVSVGFSPIHDIPPGLDHNGMMRAPTYNVGAINRSFYGDPNDRD